MLRSKLNTTTIIITGMILAFLILRNKPLPEKYSKENQVMQVAEEEAEIQRLGYDYFKDIPQDDSRLIHYIQKELMNPPSSAPYSLKTPTKTHFSQFGQDKFVDTQILHGMRNGFFIEVGAVDGEYCSNSLYYERELGWTGLLIEPNPVTYGQLLKKGRKASSVNAALSPVKKPSDIFMTIRGYLGDKSSVDGEGKGLKVKALPLYSLLLALNVSTIDYLSLDIEGQEVKVLQTLPWDKLKFRVLGIEKTKIPEGLDFLVEFMESKGYKYLGKRLIDAWFVTPELWRDDIDMTYRH